MFRGMTPADLCRIQLVFDARLGGYFPRGFAGEQSYWTVIGVDGGAEKGLLSEDGVLEVGRAGVSIEPFITASPGACRPRLSR
jgi:hypothetical protein